MNERIFELAKQADLIQWDTLSSGARTPDHASVVKARKFAELIVLECAKVAKLTDPSDGADYRSGRYWAGLDIKKHFGVAE